MPSTRRTLATLAAAAVALALAACAPGILDEEPTGPPSLEPLPSGSTPPDPNPSDFEPAPSVAPTTDPVGGDLDVACTDVLSDQQVYDFNPQMAATSTPPGGLSQGFLSIVDAGGIVCAWQHVGSGDLLLVGVTPIGTETGDSFDADIPVRGGEAGDWFVVVGSPYFEGADDQADAMIAQVGANLG